MKPQANAYSILLLLFGVVLTGCGQAFLPAPTGKPVAKGDVVGQWQYRVHGTSTAVTITFKVDGTFSQTNVTSSGAATSATGTWRLDDAWIQLSGYLQTSDGSSVDVGWYMIDGDETSTGLTLFGGDGNDPDAFVPMTKVPE